MSNKRASKLTEFIAHGSNVTASSIGHKCNRIAATGGDDKKVNLWTLSKPTCIMSLTGHTSPISCIIFSPNEDKIVSGTTTGTLKVWDLEANRQICNLIGHKSNIVCCEHHNYAEYLATGSTDAQIRLWDLRRKGCIFTYKGHSGAINNLKFSPDSKWIASASDDGIVKIWDLKAGRLLTDLKGHSSSVNAIEFHPNEFLLASGSSDRTVKFWDLEKMETVSTSPSTPNAIKLISFDPNGACLFTASNDYLHSLSWEPSKFYDSVFTQWKQAVDMTVTSSKILATSFNQNIVSFYTVDLSQVVPIGTPIPSSRSENELKLNEIPIKKASVATTSRRNFLHDQKIEASEQPDENLSLEQIQNEVLSNEKSQSDIFNEEEYNKIFHPTNEIKKPSSPLKLPQSTSNNALTRVTPNVDSRKSANKKVLDKVEAEKAEKKEKDFFIDIKVAQPAAPNGKLSARSDSNQQIQEKINLDLVIANMNNDMPSKFDRLKLDEPLASEEHDLKMKNQIDMLPTIEEGHDAFMRALQNRLKNVQIVRSMWTNGNIKSALDAAVKMNDTALVADILNQINGVTNLWNLDICAILLPSIKNLVLSKYEEHMQIGSESCKLVLKNYGKLIKSILSSPNSVGVDLSREERQRKCVACYNNLLDIVNGIEKKMPLVSSTKLLNNFREINLLMKTLE